MAAFGSRISGGVGRTGAVNAQCEDHAAPCATHADCRSGLCQTATGGKICFAACAETTDCTGTLPCQDAEVTVSGIHGTIRGCLTP